MDALQERCSNHHHCPALAMLMVGRSVSRCSDPFIANVAFEALSCYPEFEDGTRYLIVDVSIECDSNADEYKRVTATAWSAVGVYAFGLLVLNAALLFCAREAILKQKPTPLSHAIHFLYREFEP